MDSMYTILMHSNLIYHVISEVGLSKNIQVTDNTSKLYLQRYHENQLHIYVLCMF